jgi:hypothetical protein
MSSEDKRHRSHLPMANTGKEGPDHLRCKGSGLEVPSDRAIETTQGRSQRPDCPDRRCWLRRDQRLWRALSDTDRGKVGSRWAETHALPHDGSVLTHASSVAGLEQVTSSVCQRDGAIIGAKR